MVLGLTSDVNLHRAAISPGDATEPTVQRTGRRVGGRDPALHHVRPSLLRDGLLYVIVWALTCFYSM